MTEEKVIELSKKFTNEKYNECCELIDDFEHTYNEEAHWIDSGDPWEERYIQEYIDEGYLPSNFEIKEYDNMSTEQKLQVDIAITKSYIDYATECEGTRATVMCAIIHDYFEEFLDKV